MKMIHSITIIVLVLTATLTAAPQSESGASDRSFDEVTTTAQQRLEASLAELSALREQIAEEQIPLSRRLSDLESELIDVRLEYQQVSRLLDNRTLDLSNLRTEIKARQEEATYLSNLLSEYIRNFESRLHIAELQQFRPILESAGLALENSNLSQEEIYAAQAELLAASLDRLHDALGGTTFAGTAVNEDGIVKSGTFVLAGPVALFRSEDGEHIGTVEQRLGSLEPTVVGFGDPADAAAADQLVTAGRGRFPLDPTLGNAHVIESTQETLMEHIQKGGPVMVPIFVLAGAAFLVAFYKWIALTLVRKPSKKRIRALIEAVSRGDTQGAKDRAAAIKGPAGRMLEAGVEHMHEPRELVEEVMYERLLSARLKLQRWLPFVAISAAAAPLLGLLGTVTGIINTFKLITVFGTGDVKTLSGGISEALITTEFGLIVAIPSLLLHAFLSRKARGIVDQMEQAGVAFVNQLVKARYEGIDNVATPIEGPKAAEPAPAQGTAQAVSREQRAREIKEVLSDLLRPELERGTSSKPAHSPRNTETASSQANAEQREPVMSGRSATE